MVDLFYDFEETNDQLCVSENRPARQPASQSDIIFLSVSSFWFPHFFRPNQQKKGTSAASPGFHNLFMNSWITFDGHDVGSQTEEKQQPFFCTLDV